MNYIISAAIITLTIPVWGLIIHMLNRFIFSILKRIAGTNAALFIANWLTFPGVIHHELSHAFFALITGAKITEFKPFWPDKNTGSLGNINFVARGNLLIRSIQLSLSASAPVIMGTLSSVLLVNWLNSQTMSLSLTVLFIYLLFSIVIHASMSTADVKIMLKGIWVLFILSWIICSIGGIDIVPIIQQWIKYP